MNHSDLLEALLSVNENPSVAFTLKELYRDFSDNCTPEESPMQLKNIIHQFEQAQIPEYQNFINSLIYWEEQITYTFYRPTGRKQSKALTESVNSQIWTYLAVFKGVSNVDRFRR